MFVTEAEDFAGNLVTTLQKTVEDIVLVHVRLVRGGNAPVQFPRWGVCNSARALALAHMPLQWCFAQEVGSAGGCSLQKALSLRASQITEKESKRASYSPTATAKHRALSVSEDHPQARAKSK